MVVDAARLTVQKVLPSPLTEEVIMAVAVIITTVAITTKVMDITTVNIIPNIIAVTTPMILCQNLGGKKQ